MTDTEALTDRTGVKCTLRYLYEQPHKDPILIECMRLGESTFLLSAGMEDGVTVPIEEVERDLAGGTYTQFKPDCVDRHYYRTLQKACEGAVKTLRRNGKIG